MVVKNSSFQTVQSIFYDLLTNLMYTWLWSPFSENNQNTDLDSKASRLNLSIF